MKYSIAAVLTIVAGLFIDTVNFSREVLNEEGFLYISSALIFSFSIAYEVWKECGKKGGEAVAQAFSFILITCMCGVGMYFFGDIHESRVSLLPSLALGLGCAVYMLFALVEQLVKALFGEIDTSKC